MPGASPYHSTLPSEVKEIARLPPSRPRHETPTAASPRGATRGGSTPPIAARVRRKEAAFSSARGPGTSPP